MLRFSEGTLFPRVLENVRGRRVYLVQSTVFPANDHQRSLYMTATSDVIAVGDPVVLVMRKPRQPTALSGKVRHARVTSIQFMPPLISTGRPDYPRIRSLAHAAVRGSGRPDPRVREVLMLNTTCA